MALSVWQKVITSNTGVAVPSASVEVFVGDTMTHATLFSDVNGTTPLSNPFNANSSGFAQFFVAGGTYRIEASAEGADAVHSFVQLGTAQSLDVEDVVGPGDLATVATTGDHADLLNKGTNTHAQIDAHIADAGKHREINDAGSGVTDLWSASKITAELAPKLEAVNWGDIGGTLSSQADLSAALALKLESVDWGDIGGTLSSQTDLNTALGLKANTADLATVATSGDHTDLTNIGVNTHAQIDTHIASTAEGVHGSAIAATASRLVHRDAFGRAQVADPSASADIATKNYVDGLLASGMSVKNSIEIDGGSAQLVNDESTPPSYAAYGKVAGSLGYQKTHNMIASAQEAFKLNSAITVNSTLDDTIMFKSTTCSTFGAGNGFIDLGVYSTDYITADSQYGGAFTVTAFIQKTGAGTVNINVVSTGTAQIGLSPSLQISGEGIFPITFNCFIIGQDGGVNLEVEHVSGSNAITNYSHLNIVRTAGSLLS